MACAQCDSVMFCRKCRGTTANDNTNGPLMPDDLHKDSGECQLLAVYSDWIQTWEKREAEKKLTAAEKEKRDKEFAEVEQAVAKAYLEKKKAKQAATAKDSVAEDEEKEEGEGGQEEEDAAEDEEARILKEIKSSRYGPAIEDFLSHSLANEGPADSPPFEDADCAVRIMHARLLLRGLHQLHSLESHMTTEEFAGFVDCFVVPLQQSPPEDGYSFLAKAFSAVTRFASRAFLLFHVSPGSSSPPRWVSELAHKIASKGAASSPAGAVDEPQQLDSLAVVGRFILQSLSSNQHGITNFADNDIVGAGLYPFAAAVNHSCEPNCIWHIEAVEGGDVGWASGHQLQYVAMRDIPAGSELSIVYMDIYVPHVERQKHFTEQYGCSCWCARCLREQSSETPPSTGWWSREWQTKVTSAIQNCKDKRDIFRVNHLFQQCMQRWSAETGCYPMNKKTLLKTCSSDGDVHPAATDGRSDSTGWPLPADPELIAGQETAHVFLQIAMLFEVFLRNTNQFPAALQFAELIAEIYGRLAARSGAVGDSALPLRYRHFAAQVIVAMISSGLDQSKEIAIRGRSHAVFARDEIGVLYGTTIPAYLQLCSLVGWFDAVLPQM